MTRFKDLSSSLRVEALGSQLQGPDNITLGEVLNATHADRPVMPKVSASTRELEGGLWGAQEMLHLTLRISGVSRVFTHQLVRARIGVTFFQQCTGDRDQRHDDILVPRVFQKLTGPRYAPDRPWTLFLDAALEAKIAYALMLDYGIPVQEARYILPHSVETFIYLHANLAALSTLYHRRVCVMTNTWEMVLFARRLKEEILRVRPQARFLFEPSACEAGKCWFTGSVFGGKNTPWWTPDKVHDTFQWAPESFVHGVHAEVCGESVVPMEPRYFQGKREMVPSSQDTKRWPERG